jgi:hypothetical protein
MKIFFWLFPILLVSFCTRWKKEVSSTDVQKVLDRLAYLRFVQRLELEDLSAIQADENLLVEICELNKIPPKLFLTKLKETHPQLYQYLGRKYEK